MCGMEQAWTTIVDLVTKQRWDADPREALKKFRPLDAACLCREKLPPPPNPLSPFIAMRQCPRMGDLIVGFYLDKSAKRECNLHLSIGNWDYTVSMLPGQFEYCLEGTHVYPIVAVDWTDVNVVSEGDDESVSIIYAFLQNDIRKLLCDTTLYLVLSPGTALVKSNSFAFLSSTCAIHDRLHKFLNLPNMAALTSKMYRERKPHPALLFDAPP